MTESQHSDIPVNPSDFACIDLINSAFTDYLGARPGFDRITSTRWRCWFLDRYELRPRVAGGAPLDDLIELRRDLRRILEKWSREEALNGRDARALNGRIGAAPLRRRVTAGRDGIGLVEEPLNRDWTWVIASVTVSALELILTGDPRRIKTCTNPNCNWMFYDSTINRSKRYCSTTPCALLTRVRRFRGGRELSDRSPRTPTASL